MGNIIQITLDKESINLIGEIFEQKLKQFKPESPQTSTNSEYLTRKEVCDLLRISLATLHYYTKDGTLQGYRIGGRVLYRTAEVNGAVQEIQSIKYKHRE